MPHTPQGLTWLPKAPTGEGLGAEDVIDVWQAKPNCRTNVPLLIFAFCLEKIATEMKGYFSQHMAARPPPNLRHEQLGTLWV